MQKTRVLWWMILKLSELTCLSADLESELSLPSGGEGSYHSSGPRLHTSMPILEVGTTYSMQPT